MKNHVVLWAIPISVPDPIYGIERVSSAKLLGVYIQENFNCDMHFKHIITVSRDFIYLRLWSSRVLA